MLSCLECFFSFWVYCTFYICIFVWFPVCFLFFYPFFFLFMWEVWCLLSVRSMLVEVGWSFVGSILFYFRICLFSTSARFPTGCSSGWGSFGGTMISRLLIGDINLSLSGRLIHLLVQVQRARLWSLRPTWTPSTTRCLRSRIGTRSSSASLHQFSSRRPTPPTCQCLRQMSARMQLTDWSGSALETQAARFMFCISVDLQDVS